MADQYKCPPTVEPLAVRPLREGQPQEPICVSVQALRTLR